MIDIGYIVQKICYYMMNPDQNLPTANDEQHAAEIEKLRKGFSDFCEASREIRIENQGIATEIFCLEIARQMAKGQQRNGGRF